ncbi:MAG: hypothetical protein JKX97_00565 [Candidatus Lindowbacteria bacterium]|nr:hypothetical protein [Candidatus Lindowbacteria bacterium]
MLKIISFVLVLVALFVGVLLYQNESPSNLLSTFSTEEIANIKTNSSQFHDQKVTIKGVVGSRFGLFGSGLYNLDDGSASILVMTSKAIPDSGKEMIVEGVVNQAFSYGEQQVVVIIEN